MPLAQAATTAQTVDGGGNPHRADDIVQARLFGEIVFK